MYGILYACYNSTDNTESSSQRSDGNHSNEEHNRAAPGANQSAAATDPGRQTTAMRSETVVDPPAAPALNTSSQSNSEHATEPLFSWSTDSTLVTGSSNSVAQSGSIFTASTSTLAHSSGSMLSRRQRPPLLSQPPQFTNHGVGTHWQYRGRGWRHGQRG